MSPCHCPWSCAFEVRVAANTHSRNVEKAEQCHHHQVPFLRAMDHLETLPGLDLIKIDETYLALKDINWILEALAFQQHHTQDIRIQPLWARDAAVDPLSAS